MKKLLILCLALLTLCAACGKKPEPTPAPTPSATVKPTPAAPKFTNPLTGLEAKEDISKNRPVAIMLNNLEEALPQHGVSQADIIYEVAAEAGITRMLALYQDVSGVGTLGSVRSTRTYYLDIAQSMDAVLIHAGGSTYAYDELKKRDSAHIDGIYNDIVFYRDEERARNAGFEHSLFTNGELVAKGVKDSGYRTEHEGVYKCALKFGESSAASGKAANKLAVEFSDYKGSGIFEYSPKDGVYRVSEYGSPYIDGNSSEQVAVKNVLVLYANHAVIEGEALLNIEVELDSGKGLYACDGKCVEINWSKASLDSQFKYTLSDGKELVLAPGKSYINIVDVGNNVAIS